MRQQKRVTVLGFLSKETASQLTINRVDAMGKKATG